MSNSINLKDLVLVSAVATAYYSNSVANCSFFIHKDKYLSNKVNVDNFKHGVYELDGKHSYTDCDVEIIENVEPKHIAVLFNNDNETYSESSIEQFVCDIASDDFNCKELHELNNGLQSRANMKVVTVFTFDGVEASL